MNKFMVCVWVVGLLAAFVDMTVSRFLVSASGGWCVGVVLTDEFLRKSVVKSDW